MGRLILQETVRKKHLKKRVAVIFTMLIVLTVILNLFIEGAVAKEVSLGIAMFLVGVMMGGYGNIWEEREPPSMRGAGEIFSENPIGFSNKEEKEAANEKAEG